MRLDFGDDMTLPVMLPESKRLKTAGSKSRHHNSNKRFDLIQNLTAIELRKLQSELKTVHPDMSEEDFARCVAHLKLVHKWNQSMNLTSIRDFDGLVSKHLFDSLSIVEHVRAQLPTGSQRIIDLGSGAGFPGIPIALSLAHSHVTVVDASAKKSQFLTHAAAELKLANVEVINQRIQNISMVKSFDIVVARALGSLKAVVELALPLVKDNGCILVMKGRYPQQELKELKQRFDYTVKKIVVPRLDAERHLVIISPNKCRFANE